MKEIDNLLREIEEENLDLYSTSQVKEMLLDLESLIKENEKQKEIRTLIKIRLAYYEYLQAENLKTKRLSVNNLIT